MPVISSALNNKLPSAVLKPLPLDSWDTVSNTTCLSTNFSTINGQHPWAPRFPYVILIGAQKGGSSALAKYLFEHPNIAPSGKELHFLSKHMDIRKKSIMYSDYVSLMERNLISPLQKVQLNLNLNFLDATPSYMFFSDRVPQRLLCLCPWAKLLAVLRNPTDRAMSQYNMQFKKVGNQRRKNAASFDQWIQHDYQVLKALGVLRNHSSLEDFERFSGSREEMEGWKVYTKLGLNAPIGRGLYSLQLRHWFRAFAEQGKTMDLLAIRSEAMKADTNSSYARVLDHLQLPQVPLQAYKSVFQGRYTVEPMSNETRKFLNEIFEPYNRQLVDILGEEWEGVWSPRQ
jgi:hypothetical protein